MKFIKAIMILAIAATLGACAHHDTMSTGTTTSTSASSRGYSK